MIKVWTDDAEAGLIDRFGARGTSFSYQPGAPPARAVSVTMPVRLPSHDTSLGVLPIFEMNLPEGALRERLRLEFARAIGSFDDFELLGIVGRSQIGRIRYTGRDDQLEETVPFQSVDEILEKRRGSELYRYLLDRFAAYSGVSGVQPKVLIRDEAAFAPMGEGGPRRSESYRGATHIVKFWDANEFPQLAVNEYFCLQAAEACGLTVPRYRLAEDALALVIDRFDLRGDGTYRGFEDFCVLNARRTDQKYSGSYETSILKRFAQSVHVGEDLERLFTLIALNCALRNGDAHLKNFGVLYDDVQGAARLAPVYDLVTTSVYFAKDAMALTLNGTTGWPAAKELRRLGEVRLGQSPARIRAILTRVREAVLATMAPLAAYSKTHPEFAEIGSGMALHWQNGAASLVTL